jgi:hypothetical protein
MGFFSLLETFFFISLAITFVLIIMLVYHFKGRLVSMEDRYHTMFEIVNSLVKEMKNLRDTMAQTQALAQAQAQAQAQVPTPVERSPFGGNAGGFPTELFRLFQSGPGMFPTSRVNEEEDYDDENDDEEEEGEYKKIVVSDTELESEDGDEYDENNVKVISLESVSLDEMDNIDMTTQEIDMTPEEEIIDIDITPDEDEPNIEDDQPVQDESTSASEQMDYRKLDVSYLKTMVLTRGLATDTKKMKKSELIRLLEEAN